MVKDADAVVARLRKLGTPENVAGMARFGITSADVCGVSMEPLRKMAKEIGRDHDFAQALWRTGVLEARVLAVFIANHKQLDEQLMDRWARDFDSWSICDGACIHLFRKSPAAWRKAVEWTSSDEQYVKRAGFALMAALAVHDKAAPDSEFLNLLPIIEREANDERNFVKKAVNWALRQIGKRNPRLGRKAMRTARRLKSSQYPSARWIGSDALRELERKMEKCT